MVELVAGFDLDRAELLARAFFTVYFQLVNLAEEQHWVRTLRERRQQGGQVRESFEAAVTEVWEAAGDDYLAGLLDRLEIVPVLTAHPTEARRRAVVDALRRVAVELLARLDAPRLPGDDQATATRRLLEEITGLWRTAQLPPRPAEPAGRGPFRHGRVRRHPVPAGPGHLPGAGAGAGRGGERDRAAAVRRLPALGELGRRRPRRQPQRHRRDHPGGHGHPGRPSSCAAWRW